MKKSAYYLVGGKVVESISPPVEVKVLSEVDGFRIIICGDDFNYIDEKGNLLSRDNFKYAHDFCEGYGRVMNKVGDYNYIDQYGKLLSDTWFTEAKDFSEGYGAVKNKSGEWNYIDQAGKLLSQDSFTYAYSFCEGCGRVRNKVGAYNYINQHGKLLSDIWFTEGEDFNDGRAVVINEDRKYNYIDKAGNLLNEGWLMEVNIVYTTIYGLSNTDTHKDMDLGLFVWTTNLLFKFGLCIIVGDTLEEAKTNCKEIRDKFYNAGIIDGEKVVLLVGKGRAVRAIGVIGKDCWLDVRDNFTLKSFNDFNFKISSLKFVEE